MTTPAEAQAALAAAHAAKESTHAAAQKATDDAAALRSKVRAGGRGSAKISAADIAAADAAAEHAALAHQGAVAAIPALAEAAKAARVDQACDAVLAELPALAQDVVAALATIEAVLPQLVTAAERYDEFVATSLRHLEKVAPNVEPTYEAGTGLNPQRRGGTAASPFVAGAQTPADPELAPPVRRSRFKDPRHGAPSVDGVQLTSCRAVSQLAAILLPTVRDLGGQQALLENLKLLANGAPTLPD